MAEPQRGRPSVALFGLHAEHGSEQPAPTSGTATLGKMQWQIVGYPCLQEAHGTTAPTFSTAHPCCPKEGEALCVGELPSTTGGERKTGTRMLRTCAVSCVDRRARATDRPGGFPMLSRTRFVAVSLTRASLQWSHVPAQIAFQLLQSTLWQAVHR